MTDFRSSYLRHDDLMARLRAWADAHPDVVRLTSLGRTPEGREIPLLTLGPEPDRARPTLWLDGNLHASELCGSSVALAFAEAVVRLHTEPEAPLHGLPDSLRAPLKDVLVQVAPRLSPDGAEKVLGEGAYVRSVPRDERPGRQRSRWIAGDVDGDGEALLMRVEDPEGEYVEAPEMPGLLVPRRLEDEGPYYKVWPEGRIEPFDGHHVPDPGFLSDNHPDLNRNFPWSWVPEPEQIGAGAYPGSEPESRALLEHARRTPHLYAWVDLHTFGGVFIRPLGDAPDNKMDPGDLALYRQLEQWAEELTGYPMVSGFEQFTYAPDKPIHGDLAEWAYAHRGCVAYVCELWDLFAQLGFERPRRFVEHYTHRTREDLVAIARWDRQHNGGRTLRPWRPFEHPQLGRVEIGGLDPRFGLTNPPEHLLPGICDQHVAMTFRLLAIAPRLVLRDVRVEPVGEGTWRVEATVANTGYLSTRVVSAARDREIDEPVHAALRAEGCALADPATARVEVGHLAGWGRGRFDGTGALYFQRSPGRISSRRLAWIVHGEGRVHLRVGSCRTGFLERSVDVGGGRG